MDGAGRKIEDMKKKMAIVLNVDQCGACHLCETACSLSREGECNPELSRIRVRRAEMKETVLVCQQCEVLFCASVCPNQAIRRDEATGVVMIKESSCNGCRACLKACPYRVIAFHPDRKKALICDQCGGDPVCVAWCPREALQYLELTPAGREKKIKGAAQAFSLLQKIGS
jgi:carbon-monoxide dehydrogenase iron sulfur subunit